MRVIISIFLLAAVALAGCKKENTAQQAYDIQGVKVDLPKFREAFTTGSPDLQAAVNDVGSAIRYGQYDKALSALEKLAAMPGVTDAQKKAANDLLEQVKQLAAKGGGPPAK